MILLMADGESNRAIGEVVDLHYNQVGMWRARYEEYGLAGLEDEERPGRPVIYDHDDVLLLVKLVTEDPPAGSTRWTMESSRRPWPSTACTSRLRRPGGSVRPSTSSPGRSSRG